MNTSFKGRSQQHFDLNGAMRSEDRRAHEHHHQRGRSRSLSLLFHRARQDPQATTQRCSRSL